MDFDELVLELLEMNDRNSHRRLQVLSLRGVEMSNPPPTARQIMLRKIEQERRRLEALTNQLDLDMQSNIMTEFEESLKVTDRVTRPEHSPSPEQDQDDSNESSCDST